MAAENSKFPDVSMFWANWKITEEIGKGSYGTVYKAVHETAIVAGDAVAVKVINIPSDISEIQNRRLDGLSDEEIRKEFEAVRDDYVNEIRLMMNLRDLPNVVRIEDYEVVPKKDGIGWDIYIRMELLTELRIWVNEHGINAHDVIRIGKDICRALISCEKIHLLHRDIKQSNIMVNTTTNTFKLSDFGIAKYSNSLNGSLSSKGTPDYMAPEVFQNIKYDSRVDIYSLGMVLYYYMNKKRGPFLDLDRQPTAAEREDANWKRYQGEPLPVPAEAEPALAEVILHACAAHPEERFADAQKFYDALCQVEAGTYRIGTYVPSNPNLQIANRLPDDDYDPKTVKVRRAQGLPEQVQAQSQPAKAAVNTVPQKKKKSSALTVVFNILAVLLVAGAVVFALKYFNKNGSDADNSGESTTEETTATASSTTTTTATEATTKPVKQIVTETESETATTQAYATPPTLHEGETTIKEFYGEGPVRINLWSFTNEVPNMVKKFISLNPTFGKKYTVSVTIVATTNGTYQPALDAALKNGEVDMYAAEAAFVLKYSQGDAAQFAAAYKDLGIDVDKDLRDAEIARYSVDIGTRPSDNALVALGYQATGGAMIYRASIAKEVFGSSSPSVVEKEIGAGTGNYDKFWQAAAKLRGYGYPIVSGDGDIWHMVENSSSTGWIVDGKLNIAPERQSFFDISKLLLDNGWSNETSDWTPAWYADMKGVSQEGRNNKPAFCFFGPAWLINYVMVGNSGGEKAGEGTYGDWRVCQTPAGFFWGGTWVLASKTAAENADKKAGVAELIRWITLDPSEKGLQYMWANGTFNGEGGTKDCVASGKVMATANGKLDFLGGQNMFPTFIAANANCTGKNMTPYDETINSLFREQVTLYAYGRKPINEAIATFRSNVNDKLGIES